MPIEYEEPPQLDIDDATYEAIDRVWYPLADFQRDAHYDAKDNVFPSKDVPENKIDACLALTMGP
jgi:hypothetical protein